MSPTAPLVSVLLSVHADTGHLDPAIDSLLNQSLQNFELILVDDGMPQEDRLRGIAARDPRIRLIRNDRNLGLPLSLNRAVELTRAPLIARMDGDDICQPQRLACQVAAFMTDPDLGLLGSQVEVIDGDGRVVGRMHMPGSDAEIRWCSLFANPLVHPAVMFRADLLRRVGGYDPGFPRAQDYDLWDRMLRHAKAANLDTALLRYRAHAQTVTSQDRPRQDAAAARVRSRIHDRLGFSGLVDGAAFWMMQAGVPPFSLPVPLSTLPPLLDTVLSDSLAGGADLVRTISRRVLAAQRLDAGQRGNCADQQALEALLPFSGWARLPDLAVARRYWMTERAGRFLHGLAAFVPVGFARVAWNSLRSHRTVWIYGCGEGGRRVAALLARLGLPPPAGYIDSQQQGHHEGLPLINRAALPHILGADDAVLVASSAWRTIMAELPPEQLAYVVDVEGGWRLLRAGKERILA